MTEISLDAQRLLFLIHWENRNGRDEPDFSLIGWPAKRVNVALEELYAEGFIQRFSSDE